jgi:hypothetical protein
LHDARIPSAHKEVLGLPLRVVANASTVDVTARRFCC